MLTLDLHAGQIQGFFDIPTDNLFAAPVMTRDIEEHFKPNGDIVVVSPDVGGVVRARALAKRIDAPIAICDKRRERPGESEVMNVIGDVDGKRCILIDDIVDSGGTLVNAAEALAQERRLGSLRLHHARRAVGRRREPHRQLAPEVAGHHRLHPADRSRARPPRTSACFHRPAHRRGHRCARAARKASRACFTDRAPSSAAWRFASRGFVGGKAARRQSKLPPSPEPLHPEAGDREWSRSNASSHHRITWTGGPRFLSAAPSAPDIEACAIGRPGLDICNSPTIERALSDIRPDVVINTAAYTAVDDAEGDQERASALNRDGAGMLAAAAARRGTPIIHLSTDYVFDGTKASAYVEDDATGPTSVYGQTKLEGEHAVAAANPKHLILRTAWVYSPWGKNFVKTILTHAGKGTDLKVVNDQIGSPTYAPHLAQAILDVARKIVSAKDDGVAWGIYHAAGAAPHPGTRSRARFSIDRRRPADRRRRFPPSAPPAIPPAPSAPRIRGWTAQSSAALSASPSPTGARAWAPASPSC